jgi:tellurite methyltransferase
VPRDWEAHYTGPANLEWTPVTLLVEIAEMLRPGRALDLACGAGRNTLYLAELGWEVVAVDSSRAAIRILRERAASARLNVRAQVADLESGAFAIEPSAYDLICDFFYLQRGLFPQIREGVRPGGVFAAQIHLRDAASHHFVLEPGELRAAFSDWKILSYSEGVQAAHGRPTASLIARRA